MKEYLLSNDRSVLILDLHEALVAAGSADVDNVFAQDQALEDYFDGRRVARLHWNLTTYNEDLTRLVKDGVDVVIIIKE